MISVEVPTFENEDDLLFFPVRHGSPASARMVRALAQSLKPAAILVEGPVDYNPQIAELFLEHELPIAIYTYVRFSDDSRRSAFYPLAEHCPEWQALIAARALNAHVEFIDLAWERMAEITQEEHRYSDRHFLQNPYPAALAKRLHVQGFDEVWDVLFELDPTLTPETYLKRCHHFCYHLRLFGGPETEENRLREEFMVSRIREVRSQIQGPILVVTGGFHSSGLFARWMGKTLEPFELDRVPIFNPDADLEPNPAAEPEPAAEPASPKDLELAQSREVIETGITLTPFTYQRLDMLSGYASGVQGPAFYEYVWQRRNQNLPLDGQELLTMIAKRLRDKGQIISTADLIAVETIARGLAALHGRNEIWRFDILDALSSALVKEVDDGVFLHPIIAEARAVFCGTRRGIVSPLASLPAIVQSVMRELARFDLTPTEDLHTITLDLENPEELEKSRVLHRCRCLNLGGINFVDGTDFLAREDLTTLWERWQIQWSPEFEASLIENAIFGSDLVEASRAKLAEEARKDPAPRASTASVWVLESVLMGLEDAAEDLLITLQTIIQTESDIFDLAKALGHIGFLCRHNELLKSSRFALQPLLRSTYLRALWLLESLGTIKDRDAELIETFRITFDTFRTWYHSDHDDQAHLIDVFRRIHEDVTQTPLARGLATGGLLTEGFVDVEVVLGILEGFANLSDIGDFLVGLFTLAREAAQRDPRLMQLIDRLITDAIEEDFLEMLPSLRLAFTFFTPLEKHRIVDLLFGEQKIAQPASTAEHAQGAALNQKLLQILTTFGIRHPALQQASTTAQDSTRTSGETTGSGTEKDDPTRHERWRLVLGEGVDSTLPNLNTAAAQRDRLLDFLYGREYGPSRNVRSRSRSAGLGQSTLDVPEWINGVHELFPKRTIERLEKDALDRYKIEEIATRPEILARAQPSITLLKAVMRTKHLMNQEVLQLARRIVQKIVEELLEKLARDIQSPFVGALNRRRRSMLKIAKNFDAVETIRRNLKNYNPDLQKLVVTRPYFYSRVRRHVDRWRIIIVVDQSGSMVDSVIHAAVTASIFHRLNRVQTHLIAFDTNIIDLTENVEDPVETLLKVQLGGGTDIANALTYAQSKVETPHKTIIVLITDFFEGGPVSHLLGVTKALTESGVHLLGLAALDSESNSSYDRDTASQMVKLGAHVGAMTPGELAQWIAEKIR